MRDASLENWLADFKLCWCNAPTKLRSTRIQSTNIVTLTTYDEKDEKIYGFPYFYWIRDRWGGCFLPIFMRFGVFGHSGPCLFWEMVAFRPVAAKAMGKCSRICPLVAERTWFAGAESLERNITESGLECRRNSGGNPQWHEGWNRGGLVVDIDPEFMACYIAFIVVRIPRHTAMYEPISQVFDDCLVICSNAGSIILTGI